MENSCAIEFSLSSTSAKTLTDSSRRILAKLDHKMPLPSQKGYSRDYRGLAGLMGFTHDDLMIFERYDDITMKIYETWQIQPGSTIGQLIDYLENMDRQDIIQEILPSIKLGILTMENNSALECSLSSTSAKTLNDSSRRILAKLDRKIPLPSQKGCSRDYRGLAGLMGFTHDDLMIFETYKDITMAIYESWEIQLGSTIGQLFGYLENMDRYDIIQELLPSIKREIAKSQKCPVQVNEVSSETMILHSNRSFVTRQDKIDGNITIYDAYLCYADEDSDAVDEFAKKLKHSFNLKLFMPELELLHGHLDLDTDIEIIMQRCRHILIVLTPNFIRKNALASLVDFATGLANKRNQDILIPVKLEPCDVPSILNGVTIIDFTKPDTRICTQQTKWENLVLSMRSNTTTPPLSNSSGSTCDDMD